MQRLILRVFCFLFVAVPTYSATVVLASGNLQRCLGIAPNSGRMNRSPGT